MLFIIGFLLATIIHSFIDFAVSYIVGSNMGFSLKYVRFFIWDISENNGEYMCTVRKFNPIWQHAMIKPGLTEAEDIKNTNICTAVKSVVSILLATLCITFGYGDFAIGDETLGALLMGIGVGFIVHTVFYLVVYVHYMVTRKNRLMAVVKKISNDYINGYPIEYMNIPQLEALNLKGSIYEKHMYQNYRFLQKVSQGAYHELMPIVMWTENNLSEPLLKFETGSYYNLIFYYSYINPNIQKATKYFQTIKEELLNDLDSNGRRVLSYYQLCVMGDPVSARQTASDGLRVLSQFSIGNAEKEYEARLLNHVINECMRQLGNIN